VAEEQDMQGGANRPLYAVLGVPVTASPEEIKRSYRRLALQHHPDKQHEGSSETVADTFARVALAYEVLGHPQRRRRYDLSGELPQTDAALGRSAGETFLAEYLASAPKATVAPTQADMSLHRLENYEILEVDGKDVPEYMRGIVMIGLGYLTAVVKEMDSKEVVLLRHFAMDQMYALMAYEPPLDPSALEERGYLITYYDHPLQQGIQPLWSDHNGLDGRGGTNSARSAELRAIDAATIERRRLVALEWAGPATNNGGSTTEKICIPGEGLSPERLALAAQALVRLEPDLGSFNIRRLREELGRALCVEPSALEVIGSSRLMAIVFEAVEEAEAGDEATDEEQVQTSNVSSGTMAQKFGHPVADCPTANAVKPLKSVAIGTLVRVRDTSRMGEVAIHDPEDADLTFKLRFTDGSAPAEDWFGAHAVEVQA